MCGRLHYENKFKQIGNLTSSKLMDNILVIKSNGKTEEVQWLGHIRSESGIPKLKHEEVYLPVKEYTEKDILFKVPDNHCIKGYIIYSESYPNKKGLFIQTRQSTEEELKKCHHPRHPVFKALETE
jgi:hypothetical protein